MMRNMPPSPNEILILEFVTKHPGSHASLISRECGIPLNVVIYHLDRLKRQGKLGMIADGKRNVFFRTGVINHPEKEMMVWLSQSIPRHIAMILLRKGKANHTQICEDLDLAMTETPISAKVNPSRVTHHLKRMKGHGVITMTQKSRYHVFELANPDLVRKALVHLDEKIEKEQSIIG